MIGTIPQEESILNTQLSPTRTIRIHDDVWEAVRVDAFHQRRSITRVIEELLRRHYSLPDEPKDRRKKKKAA
jgi:hypothetical protein